MTTLVNREQGLIGGLVAAGAGAVVLHAGSKTPGVVLLVGGVQGAVYSYKNDKTKFSQTELAKKVVISVGYNLTGMLVLNQIRSALSSRLSTGKLVILTTTLSLVTDLAQRALFGSRQNFMDMLVNGAAALAGGIMNFSLNRLIGDVNNSLAILLRGGVGSAANAGTDQAVRNYLEGKPLDEGVTEIMLIEGAAGSALAIEYTAK